MNETTCENFLMAKLAEDDGEQTQFSTGQIESHLEFCEHCRNQLAAMQITGDLLKKQMRTDVNPDLWTAIERRIGASKASKFNLKPFVLIGVLLVVYKLMEIFFDYDLGLIFKLLPLIFMIALFIFIKENPFKINAELNLEK